LDHNRPSTLAELETWSVAILGNPPGEQDFVKFVDTFVLRSDVQQTKSVKRFLRIFLDKSFIRDRLLQYLDSDRLDVAKAILETSTKHGFQLELFEIASIIPNLVSDIRNGVSTEELLAKYGSGLIFLLVSHVLAAVGLNAIPVAVGTFGGKKAVDYLFAYNLITKTVNNHLIFMRTIEANLSSRL
jgi:hypothetical protein